MGIRTLRLLYNNNLSAEQILTVKRTVSAICSSIGISDTVSDCIGSRVAESVSKQSRIAIDSRTLYCHTMRVCSINLCWITKPLGCIDGVRVKELIVSISMHGKNMQQTNKMGDGFNDVLLSSVDDWCV